MRKCPLQLGQRASLWGIFIKIDEGEVQPIVGGATLGWVGPAL